MGNLVLSPSISNPKGITKRFHLTEFQTPYSPDQDRQELPNSVVLDFIDGRTLQCACESSTLQAHVLQSKSHSPSACAANDMFQSFERPMTLGLLITKLLNLSTTYSPSPHYIIRHTFQVPHTQPNRGLFPYDVR